MFDLTRLGFPFLQELDGKRWLVLYEVGRTTDDLADVYIACEAGATFPAPCSLIRIPRDIKRKA